MFKRGVALFCSVVVGVGRLAGCVQSGRSEGGGVGLSGTGKIDGSITVFPISQAVAEEFMAENPKVQVTVSESGTGGGFQKWVAGETDINDASRPIKDEEKKKAAENGIEPIESLHCFDNVSMPHHQLILIGDAVTIEGCIGRR